MNNEERLKKLDASKYQEVFGVKKETFERMRGIMEEDYKRKHKKGGCTPKLSVLDKLIIMLQYYREYRPMRAIAFDYDVQKSTISDAVAWVEETLIRSGQFRLPSQRKLLEKGAGLDVVTVDATECEIERPEKNKNKITPEKRNGTP